MNKIYKFNKEWLDLLLENKGNENASFVLSDNDTRILLTYIEVLQQENARFKEIFIQNRVKQEMLLEDINKYAVGVVDNYLKEN